MSEANGGRDVAPHCPSFAQGLLAHGSASVSQRLPDQPWVQ